MPRFRYVARKGPGENVEGTVEAESQRVAVARIRELGYFPLKVEEDTGETSRDLLREKLQRISIKDRNVFLRQLANLLSQA